MRLALTSLPLFLSPLLAAASPGQPAEAPGGDLPRVSIENHLLGPVAPPPPRVARPQPPLPCTKFDLHAATQFVGTSCLQIALRNMDVNDRDVNGDTPLHNAIHLGNAPAIRLLLRNGADLHLRDFEGRNAIDLAQVLGKARLYEFFLALERENQRLLDAVDLNDVVAANASLLRGATLGTRDIRLDTLLHTAAMSGNTEVGRLLVQHGANLEARNYLGETPLHVAVRRGQTDFLAMLLEAGANVNALDERRETPLTIAEVQSDPRILALLQKKHAREGIPASVEFDLDGGDGLLETAGGR